MDENLTAAEILRWQLDAGVDETIGDEPVNRFQEIVARGFELALAKRNRLVTFGIRPTLAATGFGYLQLGDRIADDALVVQRFKENRCAANPLPSNRRNDEAWNWEATPRSATWGP